jgi:hypothetical protein
MTDESFTRLWRCRQNSTISPTFSIAIAAGNGLFNPDKGECK